MLLRVARLFLEASILQTSDDVRSFVKCSSNLVSTHAAFQLRRFVPSSCFFRLFVENKISFQVSAPDADPLDVTNAAGVTGTHRRTLYVV